MEKNEAGSSGENRSEKRQLVDNHGTALQAVFRTKPKFQVLNALQQFENCHLGVFRRNLMGSLERKVFCRI